MVSLVRQYLVKVYSSSVEYPVDLPQWIFWYNLRVKSLRTDGAHPLYLVKFANYGLFFIIYKILAYKHRWEFRNMSFFENFEIWENHTEDYGDSRIIVFENFDILGNHMNFESWDILPTKLNLRVRRL